MRLKSTWKLSDASLCAGAREAVSLVRYDIQELVGLTLGEGGALGLRRAPSQPYPDGIGLRLTSPATEHLKTAGFLEIVRVADGLDTVLADWVNCSTCPTTYLDATANDGYSWMAVNLGDLVKFRREGARSLPRSGVFCSLIFQPPGSSLRWSIDRGARHRSVVIGFSANYLQRNYPKLFEHCGGRIGSWYEGFTTDLIDYEVPLASVISASAISLLDLSLAGEFRRRFVASTVEQMLCIALSRFDPAGSEVRVFSERDRKAFAAIRAWLDRRLTNPPSAEEISAQFGMNRNKLRAGFKTMFGCTVCEYIADRRLMFAHELISQGDCPIGEVASRVGFAHLSNFTTAFKHKFGYAPSRVVAAANSTVMPLEALRL